MAINENSELIVRYDGSKASFESTNGPKNTYIDAKVSKVVFITGSTAQTATSEQKRQYIWITDGSSDKYMDMSNVDGLYERVEQTEGDIDALQTEQGTQKSTILEQAQKIAKLNTGINGVNESVAEANEAIETIKAGLEDKADSSAVTDLSRRVDGISNDISNINDEIGKQNADLWTGINDAETDAKAYTDEKIAKVDAELADKANTTDVYTKTDPSSTPEEGAILAYDATNDTIKDSNYKISTTVQDLDHAEQSRIPTCAQVSEFITDTIENSNIGDLEDRVVNGKKWIKTTNIHLVEGYICDGSKSYALPSAIQQSLEYVDDIIATRNDVDSKFYIIPEVTIYGINNAIDSGKTESVVISVDQYNQLYTAVENGKQINIIIEDELPGLAPVSAYIEDCIYVEFVYNGFAYEVDFSDDGSTMIYRNKLIHTSDIEELMPLPLTKPNKDAILIFDEVNNTVKDSGLAISTTAEDIWHASPDYVPTCAQVEEFVVESINNLQIDNSSSVYVIPVVAISAIDNNIEIGKNSISGIDRDKYDEFRDAVAAGKQIYITIEEGLDGLTPVSVFIDDFIYVDFVYNGFAYKVDFEGEEYVTFFRNEISISGVVYIADFTISDLSNTADTPIDYAALKDAFNGNKTIIVPNRGMSYCVVSSISKVPAIDRNPERLVLNIVTGTNLYTISAVGGSVSALIGSAKTVKKLVTDDVIGDINTALETIIAG